jgi:hypothetical protein
MADGKREISHALGNKPSSKAICILFLPESNVSSLILFYIAPNTKDLSVNIMLRIRLPLRDVPSLGKLLRTFRRIAAL